MQALQRVFENIKLLKSCDEGTVYIVTASVIRMTHNLWVIKYGNVDKNLQKDQRSHIFDAMAEQNYSKGDVIIKQGDPGNYFYVIGKLLFPLRLI